MPFVILFLLAYLVGGRVTVAALVAGLLLFAAMDLARGV